MEVRFCSKRYNGKMRIINDIKSKINSGIFQKNLYYVYERGQIEYFFYEKTKILN